MNKPNTSPLLLMLLLTLIPMLGLNSSYQRQIFIGCMTVFSFILAMLIIRGIVGFFKPVNRDVMTINDVPPPPPPTTTTRTWEEVMKEGERFYCQKNFRQAIFYFKAAVKEAKRIGKEHLKYVKSLRCLATVYCSIGEYGKAEQLLQQASNISARVLGTEHPYYIGCIASLAGCYWSLSQYDKTESLYLKILEIKEKLLGKRHPDYLSSLSDLGGIQILNRKFSDGIEKLLEVSRISDLMITQMFSSADEKQIREYIRTFSNDYFILLSVFGTYYSELKEYTPRILDVVLKRKAISLEMTAIRRDKILSCQSPELRSKFEELRTIRKKIVRLMTESQDKVSLGYHHKIIYDYEQKAEALEKELASEISELELYQKLENAEHNTIANLLPEDTKLVEFVCYRTFDLQHNRWQPSRYLAFVLSKNPKEDIQMIDIGKASDIDDLIARFRKEMISEGRNIVIKEKKLSENNEAINEDIVINEKELYGNKAIVIGKMLYEKLFEPLLDKIGETKKLLISPDGNITLLPFEVLQMPDNRYVIENFEISYIDSGRDLLRFQYRQPPQSRSVILADPDFDLAGQETLFDNSEFQNIKPFSRLYGTKEEGEAIKKLMPLSDFLTDKDVLDEKVKQIRGPEILHIATHGFFISETEDIENLFQGKQFGDPLLRSGLALSGANTCLQGKNSAKHAEDGLLLAMDVSSMNLTGTDLVVLSACETGLGEVQSGDGIYGLRRAFTIAGAKTQIVSLWKVPDKETKDLMISFYTKISDGKGKAQALRESQREMIEYLRTQKKTYLPFLWGAFVCVGDPGRIGQNQRRIT